MKRMILSAILSFALAGCDHNTPSGPTEEEDIRRLKQDIADLRQRLSLQSKQNPALQDEKNSKVKVSAAQKDTLPQSQTELFHLLQRETDTARRDLIRWKLIGTMEAGMTRSDIHKILGEPDASLPDRDYYPEEDTAAIAPEFVSYSEILYGDDKLKSVKRAVDFDEMIRKKPTIRSDREKAGDKSPAEK
jgi:hypothetical protein